jgi:hypothetical protein
MERDMPLTKRKQKTVISRRTGFNAIPIEKGFSAVQSYFQFEMTRKDSIDQHKTYIKKNFSKKDAQFILANHDWRFVMYYQAATAFWYNSGLPADDTTEYWKQALDKRLTDLIEPGKVLYYEKLQAQSDSDKVVSLSPQQRLQRKINATIMMDLDELEDKWIEGEKASIDVYQQFKIHGLSGSAIKPVQSVIEGWLLDYSDAYHKRCEQAVEGYSHLTRPELNRRIKECEKMLADLERVSNASKATRKIRIPKPVSIDKQVSKVKYKKEDTEYKIVSVPPAQLVGKAIVYVFNCKTRKLTEYVTEDPKGFTIKGTTIQNFDPEKSRSLTLRKPMEQLPELMKTTPAKRIKLLDAIKTKPSVPNGRLNDDTVILIAK